MKRNSGVVIVATLALLLVGTARGLSAQTFSDLYNLGQNSGDPSYPNWIGTFAQARDGNLYSTSQTGGANGFGTVFQLTPAGHMKVLYSFDATGYDPLTPSSGLTLGTDGSLYGTTTGGGLGRAGTVFKITTSGVLTVVHNFDSTTEGSYPQVPPIQGTDGNFYGTTWYASTGPYPGMVYKLTPSGTLTILVQGIGYPSALVQGSDGSFYGTTVSASGNLLGVVFKITPSGVFTVLHSFAGAPNDGSKPYGAIIQASDGNFYGTTLNGGPDDRGTIYKMTPSGSLSIIHEFRDPSIDSLGWSPWAGLVQATDGKFYGVTENGGTVNSSYGVLFSITSTSTYSVLHNFDGTMGLHPLVSLFQHTNGSFYSDTYEGGAAGPGCNLACGTLYSLNTGLGAFVSFVPAQSGKVGKSIGLLGQGFTGTTKVSFNGTTATFKVVSDTYLTATVPTGATSGFVSVTTPGGVLRSNKKFRVLP